MICAAFSLSQRLASKLKRLSKSAEKRVYRIVDCITQEHQIWLVGVAGLVCAIGAVLTIRFSHRYLRARGSRQALYLGMVGMMGGATIWSTHFIAMLAYDPGFEHGFEPFKTLGSLAVAVLGIVCATVLLNARHNSQSYVSAGLVLGLTIAAMHYLGISAYLLPGRIVWDTGIVASSVVLAIGFGICAYQQVLHPLAQYRWRGGAIFLLLAISTTHFIGMSAITVQLDPFVPVPETLISDEVLGLLVLSVTGLILLMGFTSFSIETRLTLEARHQAVFSASHDALTGLPNRTSIADAFERYTQRLEADSQESAAVLVIDLNLFKEINDLHGHRAGDSVLKVVAERLKQTSRDGEMIARTGGNEFMALISDIKDMSTPLTFARRLHAAIAQPIQVGDLSVCVGAAVGIATSLQDGRDMEDLLHKSDLAMSRGKQTGQNICVFDPEMDAENREELQIVHDLRQACDNGEFEIVYQLQNDMESLAPTGFEALLRWNHPTRGRVMPGVFIPIAEKSGVIREIGLWVLHEACKEAARWDRPLSIAVNVAPQQLIAPLFVENVAMALAESGLAPARLELEVTEEGIVEDLDLTLTVMCKLKAMGVSLAMDDFGTGYSSLSMLQAFPFDKIKIDRCFVQDVHTNAQRAAIVQSTLVLGAALNIPILAEGVETHHELMFLKSAGCTSVQGYYFGKPMALADMRLLVKDDQRGAAPDLQEAG